MISLPKNEISKKGFFSKNEQIRSFLRICSHLLGQSFTENFIFCLVFIFGTGIFYMKNTCCAVLLNFEMQNFLNVVLNSRVCNNSLKENYLP